jgi:tetratricopeptide (TPR) repeat protein
MLWLLLVLFAGQFETSFKAGLIALNENNLPAAESHLEAASQLQPRNAQVWLALAQTYWKLHKLPAAEAAAAKAGALANDSITRQALLTYYKEAGNSAKSIELLRESIRRNPFDENEYFELAQIYLKLENFAAALETLDAGRKNFDKSAQLELATGVALYGLRRFPEAIDAFLKTIRLDSAVDQPYVFLGRMVDQAEDRLPKMIEVFSALAKAAPDHYMSNFLLGKALMLTDAGRAEGLLRKSIAENDRYWESHFELGLILEQERKFEEAARELRRSIELNPGDPVPHYRLARIYDRLGKTDEARAERAVHAKLSAAAPGVAVIK